MPVTVTSLSGLVATPALTGLASSTALSGLVSTPVVLSFGFGLSAFGQIPFGL